MTQPNHEAIRKLVEEAREQSTDTRAKIMQEGEGLTLKEAGIVMDECDRRDALVDALEELLGEVQRKDEVLLEELRTSFERRLQEARKWEKNSETLNEYWRGVASGLETSLGKLAALSPSPAEASAKPATGSLEDGTTSAMYKRYGELVDKQFSSGLGEEEEEELHQLNTQLNVAEEGYYKPAIDALKKREHPTSEAKEE